MSNGPPSRDRRSLQDLAKLASAPSLTPAPPRSASKIPPPAGSAPSSGPASGAAGGPTSGPRSGQSSAPMSGPGSRPVDEMDHDSGIVDLKMIAQADEGAEERSQSTALASAALFDEETPARPSSRPASSKSAPPSSARGLPAAAASSPASARKPDASGPRARASAVAVAGAAPQQGSNKAFIVGLGGLLLVGAVGAAFLMRSSKPAAMAEPAASPAAAPATPPPSAVAAATPPPATPAGAAAPAAGPEPAAANADPAKAPVAGGHPAVRRGSAAGKSVVTGNGGSTVSPLSAMMAEATATPAASPPPTEPGALGAAVQNAAGGSGNTAPAADQAPAAPHYALGSVPQKPSQGTITSALGSVLPAARSCMNPDDPISRAHITFASGGNVSAVTVTGHAAGTPVEGCIKSALLRATVPAFADESYGATVTIRPN